VTVNVPAGTPIGTTFNNSATLVVNGNQVDTSTVVTTVSNEQITITKTPSKNPVSSNPNESFSYNVTVTNNGNATATDIVVVDTLPAALNGPTWTNQPVGGGNTCSNAADVVTCEIATLGPGSSVNISIPVNFAAAQLDGFDFDNTATVTECLIGGVACAENPSASTTVTVLNRPVLSMVKTVETGDPVIAGEEVVYSITIFNSGGSDAEVTFRDVMPAALENVLFSRTACSRVTFPSPRRRSSPAPAPLPPAPL
jgi:uncharacterized repeat protein (TIGR01451 family)